MRRKLCCWCVWLLLSVLAEGAEFNFSYQSTGDPELKPAQIFDDGSQTYFQMRGLQSSPAIFVELADGLHLLEISQQGGFLTVPMTANVFVLRFGQLRRRVIFTGEPSRAARLPPQRAAVPLIGATAKAQASYIAPPPTFGAAAPLSGDPDGARFVERDAQIPFAEGSSRLSRESALAVTTALGRTADIAAVTISGRSDGLVMDGLARARALAVRDRILSAGVPVDVISIREAAPHESSRLPSRADLSVTWRRDMPSVQPSLAPAVTQQVATTTRALNAVDDKILAAELSLQARATATTASVQAVAGYVLKKDQLIHQVLQQWAQAAGWELVWRHPKSWRAIADTRFDDSGDVSRVMSEVIGVLRHEGKPVRLQISDGNRVMEVISDEVRHD